MYFEMINSRTKLFRLTGRPVSWIMLAPAITPRQTPDGSNNPGLRLYRFNKNTGQVSSK